MKLLKVWLVALSLFVPLLLSTQAAAQVSIMPVGDSITQGIRGECSYRRPLSQALIENSCNVNFVGSRMTAGAGGTANNPATTVCAAQNTDHQAISGYRADQILNNTQFNFTTELNTHQPDIVLLHIGSNDVFQNQTISSTVDDVNDIIDRVFARQPAATVVVADVIPWSEVSVTAFSGFPNANRDMLAQTALLSIALEELVDTRVSNGDNVVLVEVSDSFDNDLMTIDGVHPNPIGEALISNRMLTALYDLGVCGSAPTDVQPPITYISVPSEENEVFDTSLTLSGTAVDEGGSGIDRVRIAIENSDGHWLNEASGTFNAAFDSSIVANIPSRNTSATTWSYTTNLSAGDYRLYALALDSNENQVEAAAGNGQPNRNEKVWTSRAFVVTESPGAAPPSITSPAEGSTLTPNSATFTWSANGSEVTQWWLYAGSAESGSGQFAYDRGESLDGSVTSTVLTGLPGDSSEVYVTLWYRNGTSNWKTVITSFTAASTGGGPAISSPSAGATLDAATQNFTWTDNGVAVGEYWLYAGSSLGGADYYNSGTLSGRTSAQVTRLPTDGETVYVRLWYRETGGAWKSVDSTYTAASIVTPAITSPSLNGATISATQTFSWTDNGTDVGEWWLYAGTNPGSADLYNSRTLGGATSDTVSGLPSGTVNITLWFRPAGGLWQSARYSYTVE